MKSILVLFSALCFSISVYSQKRIINDEIHSLQDKYCIDCTALKKERERLEEIDKDAPPPPPPLSKDNEGYADLSCKKKYEIPASEFLTIYPFDADSVLIAIPDSCFWLGESRTMRIVDKLSTDQLFQLADILYNYDYNKPQGIFISVCTESGCGRQIPNVRFIFYNRDKVNYLDIMDDAFIDNFDGRDPYNGDYPRPSTIYWGGECIDTFNNICRFVLTNFECNVSRSYNENDCIEEIKVEELKELIY